MTVLHFLGTIEGYGEKGSIATTPNGDKGQDLHEVFKRANQELEKGVQVDTTSCARALANVKERFTLADEQYRKKHSFIMRLLIKLWHWITRQPTLEQTYHSLASNIIKSSPWWKGFHKGDKRDYLTEEIFKASPDPFQHLDFYAATLEQLSKKESPELILEGILAALNRSGGIREKYAYLLASRSLHETLSPSEPKRRLLDLAYRSLKRLDPKFLKNSEVSETLLIYAIANQHALLVSFIQKKNRSLFDSDMLGRLLYRAISSGSLKMSRFFMKRNTNLHVQDRDGEMALHRAVALDRKDLVAFLLRWGAKGTIENHEGKTPKDLASTPELLALFSG